MPKFQSDPLCISVDDSYHFRTAAASLPAMTPSFADLDGGGGGGGGGAAALRGSDRLLTDTAFTTGFPDVTDSPDFYMPSFLSGTLGHV